MRVACFDIGIAEEDYAISNCKKYGGGALIGRYFKQNYNVHLYATEKSFENLDSNDRVGNCFKLAPETCKALQYGFPIDMLFDFSNYDIILHGHTHFSFNRTNKLKVPIVHWAGFGGDCGSAGNNYILLYRKCFKAEYGEKAKYVKIGKDVPKIFQEHQKSDFIFQCTQHCRDFDTNSIAQECLKHNIKGYFAGPIRDYNLMDYIDNKTTFYLGQISEQEKLEYTRNARLYTLPLTWDVVFSQSAIEANGLGTPLLTRRVGWFNEYIKEGINGYFYNDNFLEVWNNCDKIDQRKCWESAREFSLEEVERTFYQAFNEIRMEWNYNK